MLFIMLVGHPPFDGEGVKESIFTRVVIGDYKVSRRGIVIGLSGYIYFFFFFFFFLVVCAVSQILYLFI